MPPTLAIDWAGAKTGARTKIFLAEVRDGRLIRLESGRDRTEVVDHVIDLAESAPDLIVGLDFAFSLPRWFVDQRGATTVDALWSHVAAHAESWLAACDHPFWGRPGRKKPDLPEHFRRTETAAVQVAHSTPKSVFQIGGAGAVGTGSLRGMPHLARLRSAGFAIWPFHDRRGSLVVEIYPRLLTGAVKKSSQQAREAYLERGFPEMPSALLGVAASSEDAFDAAVSAMIMARHRDALEALTRSTDATELLEGAIWWPAESRGAPAAVAPASAAQRTDCPFCASGRTDLLAESRHAIALPDPFPQSRGHALVVPRAHVASIFDLPADAQADVLGLVARVRAALMSEHAPDGFRVGIDDGDAARRSVEHAHVHVIPWYR
jgi:diadenosine tetraphosphate (Ap4A) HIT family hydrolase